MYARFVLSVVYALSFFFTIQTLSAQTDSLPKDFYSYKLENGLEIYVQEDFTLPSVKIEYVSKAGTIRQQKDTAGIFRLYSKLFWQNTVSDLNLYTKAGATNFSAECTLVHSRYGFNVPAHNFEKVFTLFASSLKHCLFSDNSIQDEFEIFKTETASWISSASGFINSTIDSLIFSKAPWQKDSSRCPAMFAKMNTEQVRQKLSQITKNWYVPNQSALFICGPLSAQNVLATVKKELSDWERSFYSKNASIQNAKTHGGRFVLLSNTFSPDFNQALIQYTAPEPAADTTFTVAAELAAEILQKKWSMYNSEEKDISFSKEALDGRLSVQALFPLSVNTKRNNPVADIDNLLKELHLAVQNITESELKEAKARSLLLHSQAFKGSESFIHALSARWAYGGVGYFFEWPQSVHKISVQQIQNVFTSPWIFIFTHPSRHAGNDQQFKEAGWEILKPKRKSYTTDETAATEQKENIHPYINSLYKYAKYTKNLINRFTLSSGMSISVQKLPNAAWTSCILNISGGELKYGFSKRGLESLAILNLRSLAAKKAQELYAQKILLHLPDIQTKTELFSGRLFFTCPSENLSEFLNILSSALKNNDLIPAQADELYFAQAYKRHTAAVSPDDQLNAAAAETFFGGTEGCPFFNLSDQQSFTAAYKEIRSACLSLYNPQNIDLILCGNIPYNIAELGERYFGKGAPAFPPEHQKIIYTKDSFEPAFTAGEQSVKLRRIFLSDSPAQLAGERPARLIPTKDFSDPAQLYLKSPLFGTKDEVVFSALMHEIAHRLTQSFQNQKDPPALQVQARTDSDPFFLASLHFAKVKNKNRLQKAFTDCLKEFAADLDEAQQKEGDPGKKENAAPSPLREKITIRYTGIISGYFATLESRANLIRQALEYTGDPASYIERLLILDQTSIKDFSAVFTEYIERACVFWLFSADTT